MKLFSAPRAPNPRRVRMFIAEKAIPGIEVVDLDLLKDEHRDDGYAVHSPFARVPALQLDDGRVLTESRAICSWLEGRFPEPNLMGVDADERAFIECVDRQVEFYLFLPLAMAIRHGHPGLASLERPQIPEYGRVQAERGRRAAQVFEQRLAAQDWFAGERFTIADITAFCALEFARGLLKFRLDEAGLPRLAAWRERVAARPSAALT